MPQQCKSLTDVALSICNFKGCGIYHFKQIVYYTFSNEILETLQQAKVLNCLEIVFTVVQSRQEEYSYIEERSLYVSSV